MGSSEVSLVESPINCVTCLFHHTFPSWIHKVSNLLDFNMGWLLALGSMGNDPNYNNQFNSCCSFHYSIGTLLLTWMYCCLDSNDQGYKILQIFKLYTIKLSKCMELKKCTLEENAS